MSVVILMVSEVTDGPLWHPAAAQVPALAGEPERPAGEPEELVTAWKEINKEKINVSDNRVVFFVIIERGYELIGVENN